MRRKAFLLHTHYVENWVGIDHDICVNQSDFWLFLKYGLAQR